MLPPPPHPDAVPAGQRVGHPPGTRISLPKLWFCRCLPRFVAFSRSSRPAGEARASVPGPSVVSPGGGTAGSSHLEPWKEKKSWRLTHFAGLIPFPS